MPSGENGLSVIGRFSGRTLFSKPSLSGAGGNPIDLETLNGLRGDGTFRGSPDALFIRTTEKCSRNRSGRKDIKIRIIRIRVRAKSYTSTDDCLPCRVSGRKSV